MTSHLNTLIAVGSLVAPGQFVIPDTDIHKRIAEMQLQDQKVKNAIIVNRGLERFQIAAEITESPLNIHIHPQVERVSKGLLNSLRAHTTLPSGKIGLEIIPPYTYQAENTANGKGGLNLHDVLGAALSTQISTEPVDTIFMLAGLCASSYTSTRGHIGKQHFKANAYARELKNFGVKLIIVQDSSVPKRTLVRDCRKKYQISKEIFQSITQDMPAVHVEATLWDTKDSRQIIELSGVVAAGLLPVFDSTPELEPLRTNLTPAAKTFLAQCQKAFPSASKA